MQDLQQQQWQYQHPALQQEQQQTQQTSSPDDTDGAQGDAGIHGFWQHGCPCIFDFCITDMMAYSNKNRLKRYQADMEKEDEWSFLDDKY